MGRVVGAADELGHLAFWPNEPNGVDTKIWPDEPERAADNLAKRTQAWPMGNFGQNEPKEADWDLGERTRRRLPEFWPNEPKGPPWVIFGQTRGATSGQFCQNKPDSAEPEMVNRTQNA